MELLDILKSACGKDENHEAKSAVTINIYQKSVTDDMGNTPLNSHTSLNSIVDIRKLGEFIMVDLCFPVSTDSDLRLFWAILENYGESQSVTEETEVSRFCTLTIVPKSYNGQYFINAVAPVFWALQSEKPNRPQNVVRLAFLSEEFSICETDEIDAAEIEAAVEREFAENERREFVAAQKEAERDEILKKREAEFNKQRFSN